MESLFEKIAIVGLLLLAMASLSPLTSWFVGIFGTLRYGGFTWWSLLGLAAVLGNTLWWIALAYWVPKFIRRHLMSEAS